METDMITDQEIRQFDEIGAVTLDTPLTGPQVAAASAAFDRLLPLPKSQEGQPSQYRAGLTCSFLDPELVDIIQHPFFEEVAKRVLRADAVHFFQTAIVTAYPQPNTPFSFDQHVDIQYPLSDFQAVPKGIICSYFLWLTDVNAQRAPLMYRPGSHLLLAAERERHPELRGAAPQVAGASLAQLPALNYAPPLPILAKAGQVSVLTTAMVHGASTNVDTVPRKDMVITFVAAGVKIGLPPGQAQQKREYDRELRQRLRPERAHIVAIES
jgi:ectoine hydroxylase-related dioxygenase (phytanoyl-CoA dioxygenase family)